MVRRYILQFFSHSNWTTISGSRSDQDIQVSSDGVLDYSKSHRIINSYDLNALEAALEFQKKNEGCIYSAASVGDARLDDQKIKKDILSRGPDDLFVLADDDVAEADTYLTASALSALLDKAGEWDALICGDGSADSFSQQVDVQVAEIRGIPVINGVAKIDWTDGHFVLERILEDDRQIINVAPPCVISVIPDVAKPHICGMKEILQAGKKPSTVFTSEDLDFDLDSGIEVVKTLAPEEIARKHEMYFVDQPGELDQFIRTISNVLK